MFTYTCCNTKLYTYPIHTGIDEFPKDIFTQQQRRHGAIILHFLVVRIAIASSFHPLLCTVNIL